MKIVILLFDNYTALDIAGPYEVLSRLPKARIFFVGQQKRVYKDKYGLGMIADYSTDEITEADLLLIPGGPGVDAVIDNEAVLAWIRRVDSTTQWTTSVCTGSLLLAAAGILEGKDCTTHWRKTDQLKKYDVVVKNERYVQDGKIFTAAGVSAGIDMALYLVSKIAGEHAAKIIQLSIEYDPAPPFGWGSPDKVPAEVLEELKNKR